MVGNKGKRILLLISSYYFYMCWRWDYIFLILGSTIVDYISAIQIYRAHNNKEKKLWLWLSLSVNIGILVFFKYYYFFTHSIEKTLGFWNIFFHFPDWMIILPVGISFYTFQTMSYSIDVYRGDTKPEKSFLIFALYVSFFPQLVAGPIERSYQLLPQFRNKVSFNYERIRNGIVLITWGFFKKLVIADRLAEYVDHIYNNSYHFGGVFNILATYFFAFQIYCDFSGYTDIAIGTAMILGIRLMTNFRQPYFSTSIREFWGRWHISLSTWFRDYLYIPLGGNRVTRYRWYMNLIIVFLISGLWHGAGWNFVIWGALHGLYLVLEIVLSPIGKRMVSSTLLWRFPKVIRFFKWFVTFHLIMVGWVFFRSSSVDQALRILSYSTNFEYWGYRLNAFIHPEDFQVAIYFTVLLIIVEWLQVHMNLEKRLSEFSSLTKWILYILLVMIILVFGKFDQANFLYFQF